MKRIRLALIQEVQEDLAKQQGYFLRSTELPNS